MSKFLNHLDVRVVVDINGHPVLTRDGHQLYQLLNPFRFKSNIVNDVIEVPTGFYTDFASVPRWPIIFGLFGDTSHLPAVIHDYLYSTKSQPRDISDKILREAMTETSASDWRCKAFYLAVRIGGASHFGSSSYV